MAEHRYPLASLLEATGMTESQLGQRIGLDGTTLKRARERGFVEEAADRYAQRAGFVAWMVWPELRINQIADYAIPCRECGEGFVPKRRGNVFCNQKCNNRWQKREWKRRNYRDDPEYRAKSLAKQAAWAAENRRALMLKRRRRMSDPVRAEAQRAYRRAYYLANREVEIERSRQRRAKAAA